MMTFDGAIKLYDEVAIEVLLSNHRPVLLDV
jgi:hypothetical protein